MTWPTPYREPSAFTEADILFHLGIALATGNTMIRVQMEGMRSVQREVSELFSRRANRTDADWNATVERHRARSSKRSARRAGARRAEDHRPFRGGRHRLARSRRSSPGQGKARR